jgi:flagellar hook-associated protein 2
MGTVGLNFGSPTSGAGFDVDATVNKIVANLQKVEQPWKDQLSTLQSQDTAISSLGTLLSKLSTDVSALTDFNGILAQKTGSSSDNNVLELTSASNSAVAGTHTVVVNNLARTSSGYLAAIGSASDKLTGSITFQVGNGKAHTISLPSSGGTLASLAQAINSSGAGVKASVLTDSSGSRLSLVSGTSGTGGNIGITANSIVDTQGVALAYKGTAGSDSGYSSGNLAGIFSAADTLSGSISIQVGSGAATRINIDSSNNSLATLADSINSSGLGVTASVVSNSNGSSSLSLVSQTLGSSGTLAVTSNVTDVSPTLGYTAAVTGVDASLNVDGVDLTSASNTVSNLIPGLTFQLLSASPKQSDGSLEPIQVVIGNDNSSVETAINSMVTDYNAVMAAINAQEGNDSSGKPEPLFGSPTLSLIQQQLLSGFNVQNPNGSLDSVSDNTGTTLSGSLSIQVADGTVQTFTVGDGANGVNTFYTGSGPGANTLQGLADAINAANASRAVTYSGTAGADGEPPTTSTGALVADASAVLSGSISIQVGDGTTETVQIGAAPVLMAADTIYTGTGATSIQALADSINSNLAGVTASVSTNADGVSTLTLTSGTAGSAGTLNVISGLSAGSLGVSASVQTSNHQSYLMLQSSVSGASGALSASSSLTATSNQLLGYAGSAGVDATSFTAATFSSGALSGIPQPGDTLSGTLSIQAGSGASHTIALGTGTTLSDGTPVNTLTALEQYINDNSTDLGISAQIVQNSGASSSSLRLTSNVAGSAGNLTVNSNVLDTSNQTARGLTYSNSSDISTFGAVGVSMNNDGTIAFDPSVLDTILNTDFGSVAGMFQSVNSWGRKFATMLDNAGTGSSVGVLKLAQNSNSNVEESLNNNIARQDALIADQQKRLTAELNQANQILQALPNQLNGMDMLYSAITGYNQKG